MDKAILKSVKADFLTLTKMYANWGALTASLGSVPLMKKQFKTMNTILEQFREIGEQLKILGEGLDALGGKSVLHGPNWKPGRTPNAN